MLLKVWPLDVFIVFVMMWLHWRCTVRLHSYMVENKIRARLLRFAAVQTEQRGFFPIVPVVLHVYCRPAAKDCLGQAKGSIILASSCHKLEQHGMETKFLC